MALADKILSTKLMNNDVKVESATGPSVNVGANGGTAWTQVRCPANMQPVAIVGYYLDGGSGCAVYNMRLQSDSNGYYGSFALRNGSTTQQSVKVTADFLCRVGGG